MAQALCERGRCAGRTFVQPCTDDGANLRECELAAGELDHLAVDGDGRGEVDRRRVGLCRRSAGGGSGVGAADC